MKALKQAVQIISYLLTVFGSFLLNIAPPASLISGENLLNLTGLVSFILLGLLLLIKAIIKISKKRFYKAWLTIGIISLLSFSGIAITYHGKLDDKVFSYFDNTKIIKGDILQPSADSLKRDYEQKNHLQINDSELLAKYGGIEHISFVWTIDSIKKNEKQLNMFYIATVLTIALSIFCLIEGIIERR